MAAASFCLGIAVAPPAAADPWAAPGDARLRHDLLLLADAGIVRAPLSSWPVFWGEVARDVRRDFHGADLPAHVGAALERVRLAAARAVAIGNWNTEARLSASQDPIALRRFADVPREEGEITGAAQYTGDRFALRLQATAVADPADGKHARPDGSYAGVVLGNWVVSAGYVERWWGPGWEGSLILGTNARPLPALTIERNFSDPIDHPWLAWIGRWRVVATLGQFEGGRSDAPDARFFGMRVTWKPHDRIEVGFTRSAQWCGAGRPCDVDTFVDLFLGRDNDQPLSEQPGNQMAGFDVRWALPWAPVALYFQAIGEDEANSLPSKYLGLLGTEIWGGIGDRSWRAHLEFADTACAFYQSAPEFGCAYNNSIYSDGYQYRSRSLGHALDGDSRQVAAGFQLVEADGSSWELSAQDARVNRRSAIAVHSVSPVAADVRSADLAHRRDFLAGELAVRLGYEERSVPAAAGGDGDLRGFVSWSRQF